MYGHCEVQGEWAPGAKASPQGAFFRAGEVFAVSWLFK